MLNSTIRMTNNAAPAYADKDEPFMWPSVALTLIQERHDAGVERVFRADNQKSVPSDQFFEQRGPVTKVIDRCADVGADGFANEARAVHLVPAGNHRLDGGADAV